MARPACLCAAVLGALVLAGPAAAARPKPLPELTPVANDGLVRAREAGRLTEAQYALERARSLVRLGSVRSRFGEVARPGPREATLILRDLFLRLRGLSAQEQEQARRLLARPTTPSPGEHAYTPSSLVASRCDLDPGGKMCFHWIETTTDPDAPPGADGSTATVPAWVTTTANVFEQVWQAEVGSFGYRAPRSDATSPGQAASPQLDVYLADIGKDPVPLFGYCTTDDPNSSQPGYPYFAFSTYCVVDEDFLDFGHSEQAEQFLKATAAHEFFHAIQFAYDAAEDLWFLEGTAVWMEDEVYDDINDNLNFLENSALTSPGTPVDLGAGGFEYGSWIFWRFLAETLFADPLAIRQIWERADGSEAPGALDEYSLQAAARVSAARWGPFRLAFARFGWVNRLRAYSEGASYPVPPTASAYRLGPGRRGTGLRLPTLEHLTERYIVFRPNSRARASATLKVNVNLPDRATGSAATLLVVFSSGTVSVRPIPLGRDGDGARRVPFGRGRVARAELVLTNGSTRFRCWLGFAYSCAGAPRDDFRTYKFRATYG